MNKAEEKLSQIPHLLGPVDVEAGEGHSSYHTHSHSIIDSNS